MTFIGLSGDVFGLSKEYHSGYGRRFDLSSDSVQSLSFSSLARCSLGWCREQFSIVLAEGDWVWAIWQSSTSPLVSSHCLYLTLKLLVALGLSSALRTILGFSPSSQHCYSGFLFEWEKVCGHWGTCGSSHRLSACTSFCQIHPSFSEYFRTLS